MWNTFYTDGTSGITAGITTYPVGDRTIHAYVVTPHGDGPFPGVVAAHHRPGWDEFYQEFCERLGRHGYQVICPDLYCRVGHGRPDDVAAKMQSEGGVHDATAVSDLEAAMAWLKAQECSNGKVGIIGSCSGGRHAVLTASLVPGFSAVVDLWGGGVVAGPEQLSPARPVAPIDYTARLEVPVLGLFGNEDQSPSPEQVDAHEAELKRLGKQYEFYRYEDAGHGFFYYHRPRYRQAQAMDGWEKVFDFFGRELTA